MKVESFENSNVSICGNCGNCFNCFQSIYSPSYNGQKLTGPPNPKTLIPPIVVPPIADINYWKASSTTIPSGINTQLRQEVYQNGYVPYIHTNEIQQLTHETQHIPTTNKLNRTIQ